MSTQSQATTQLNPQLLPPHLVDGVVPQEVAPRRRRRPTPPIPLNPTPTDLLYLALSNNAAIDVIERLTALQEKAMLRDAEIVYNDTLNRVQEQIKRIAPDMENPKTKSKWASYAAIDRVIRPIYAPEGISLSFTHADCPKPDHIRVICRVALHAHVEPYQIDMPVDPKGPQGGDVMTMTSATGAADSFAKRYLVKDIFNIAVADEDTDGNAPTNGTMAQAIARLKAAPSVDKLRDIFREVYPTLEGNTNAQLALIKAKDARKRELQ